VINNSFVSVDSFFIIGGILLGYLTFRELDKTNSFLNVPLFYLHRYIRYKDYLLHFVMAVHILRISGIYAFVIGYTATIFKFLQWGPRNRVEETSQACRDTWYTNLAYINIYNYRWDMELCNCLSLL